MSMSIGPYPPPATVPVCRVVTPPMHFLLRPFAGAWSLSEESGMVAGIFATADAALAYARDESRRAPGSSTVIELGAEPLHPRH